MRSRPTAAGRIRPRDRPADVMKVVGTGSPVMLTLRVKSSEVAVLREVLCRRRAEEISAAGVALRSRDNAEVEGRDDEMFLISKLLDDLRRHVPDGQPRELVGPTCLLDPVIREAAAEATERL